MDSSRLDYLNHELALRAVELLQTFPKAHTRICAGTNCGWLFIDRCKGGQRRWCDMATCGNAAKRKLRLAWDVKVPEAKQLERLRVQTTAA